jgi:cytidylate kinase
VITLFEKYGAGARQIGPRLAEALGVEWMDQAFSSADIESEKYPGAGSTSDRGGGLAGVLGRFAAGATVMEDASIPLGQAQDADMVAENTRNVQEAAKRGTVMLGRNGAFILGGLRHALHVQLDAPLRVRIARAAREAGIDETRAARRQRNEDRIRREMSEQYYHWNPMDIDRYDLVLNLGRLDLQTSVDIILAAYRAKTAALNEATPDP